MTTAAHLDRTEPLPRPDADAARPAPEDTGLHDLGDLWTDLGGSD